MTIEGEKDTTVKCVFCGKELDKDTMVRYRGALACRNCAKEKGPTRQFNERPFYILAAIGCIVAIPTILYTVMHGLILGPLPGTYSPPMAVYFGGFVISIPFQALGFLALNKTELPKVAILTTILSLGLMAIQAWSLYDFVVNGPTYLVETTVHPKDFTYYSLATVTYTLFMATAAGAILIGYGRTNLNNPAVAAGGMYLLGSGTNLFIQILPTVGFFHVFIYAVAFVFFMTRQDVREPDSIASVDYKPMDAEAS